MPAFTDQLRRTVELHRPPERIVSTVPSQTELLYDLGLGDYIVGNTLFCVHPEERVTEATRIGGTKKLKLDVIRDLEPDLIIANKEENTKEDIEALMAEFPVWVSDVSNLDSALAMIDAVGELTDTAPEAHNIIGRIRNEFKNLQPSAQPIRAAYLIWREPYMTVGNDTIIHNIMARAGFENVFGDRTRYPEITAADIAAAAPEFVLLSSEPYPFKEQHLQEIEAACPDTRAVLVNGEMFSWYGSRLVKSGAYLTDLVADLKGVAA